MGKGLDKGTAGTLIIFYDPSAGSRALLDAARIYGSEVIYEYRNFNGIAVTVPRGKTIDEAIQFYERVEGVIQVNRDEMLELMQPQ